MAEPTRRKKWSEVKAPLEALDRKGLVSLLGDLYDANEANRRFLHARLAPDSRSIEEYRRLVVDAIYPDPFSKRCGVEADGCVAPVRPQNTTFRARPPPRAPRRTQCRLRLAERPLDGAEFQKPLQVVLE